MSRASLASFAGTASMEISRRRRLFSVAALVLLAISSACSTQKPIDAWRAMRFGMFVHCGPVSLAGTEIGWSRGKQVPKEEYDELYRRFDPKDFDARSWAKLAKDAGMRYLVLTTKHHDGFCLWPSRFTDYDIANTPFGRDLVGELAKACRAEGVRFGAYYSLCDWKHPDYPLDSPGGRKKKPKPNMPRYFEYVKAQTAELIERYGPLQLFWFDGEWEAPWTERYGRELHAHLLQKQASILVNNRIGKGRKGMEGKTKEGTLLRGNFDTPEQRVGSYERERPWETCMTICRQWAWKPGDRLKSLAECIRTLVSVIGGDGNLLLNVGPMPNGKIEARQADRLRELGAWVKRHGKAIYGTRGGPYRPGPWGASTCRGRKLWLFVLRWPDAGPLRLPKLDARLVSLRSLDGGVRAEKTMHGLSLMPSTKQRRASSTWIEMTLDREVLPLEPVEVRWTSGSLAKGGRASASNVYER